MYPATGYVLEVEGPTLHSDVTQSSSNGTLVVKNFLGNEAYSFRVVVSNSVGNVSTDNITICESLIIVSMYNYVTLLTLMYTCRYYRCADY